MKKILLIAILFCMEKGEAQTSPFSTIDSLFAKGRYQLALKGFDNINSTSFLANYKKALIYESIDDHLKTVQFLKIALTFKENTQASLKLAKTYQKIKKSQESITIYEKLLAKDSLNLVLEYQLGKLYLVTKKGKKAVSLFKDLIKKDGQNANYSYRLALGYALMNEKNYMINSFIDTYEKDTTHLKAIAHLASSFQKLNDIDSTQLFVEKGLRIDKDHINLNKLKINQLYREKKYAESLPLLLNLDTIDEKDTYSTSMLGRSYYNLDSLEKAKTYFRKLSRTVRKNFKALTYLGHIDLKEQDYKSAYFNYLMATAIGKEKRDEEYFGLATVALETNKPKEALTNFEKAYRENSKNYKALYQLAKLSDDYYKEKKIAYKHYTRYLDRFQDRDNEITAFVKSRVHAIKKESFMKGESLE